jgi:hypothetical protein
MRLGDLEERELEGQESERMNVHLSGKLLLTERGSSLAKTMQLAESKRNVNQSRFSYCEAGLDLVKGRYVHF